MAEEPKVTLTDEQWAYIKRHEDERTREINRHNTFMQQLLTDAIAIATKPQSDEDKRDWFASQALMGILANRYQSYFTNEQHANNAYALADAMLAARKGKA